MPEAYPLAWPQGWPRTAQPKRARFSDKTMNRAENLLNEELKRLGAKNIVVSSNIIRSAQPKDRGVAVYFIREGKEQCIPCDKWDLVEHNIYAIAMTIEALRGIDRWGAKSMVDAAFRGFTALPAPDQVVSKTPKQILGVVEDMKDLDYITFKYKQKAKELHPDAGGDIKEFQALTKAYEQIIEELKK
jgi:hypothetical protein